MPATIAPECAPKAKRYAKKNDTSRTMLCPGCNACTLHELQKRQEDSGHLVRSWSCRMCGTSRGAGGLCCWMCGGNSFAVTSGKWNHRPGRKQRSIRCADCKQRYITEERILRVVDDKAA